MKMAKHPRFPDYAVSSDGKVFRVNESPKSRPGEIKGRVLASGYRQFKLVDQDGRQVFIRANRLIAETFLGVAPSEKHHCAHNDGVRLNNNIENLRWATAKENVADLSKHGTKRRGAEMPNAKLNLEQLAEVRASYTGKHGEIRALAQQYNTGYSTMNRIIRGRSYSALDKKRAEV